MAGNLVDFNFPQASPSKDGKPPLLDNGPLMVRLAMFTTSTTTSPTPSPSPHSVAKLLFPVKEECEDLANAAFEFSLREFSGGRGYLHWNAETGSHHWSTLASEDVVIGEACRNQSPGGYRPKVSATP